NPPFFITLLRPLTLSPFPTRRSSDLGTQNRGQFAVLQSERYVLQNLVAVDGLLEPSDLEGRHSTGQKGVRVEIRAAPGPGTPCVKGGSRSRSPRPPGHGS